MDAIGCGVLKFRRDEAANDLICEYANGEAKKIFGDAEGLSWSKLSGAYSLPIRFDEEVLKLPDGNVCKVVKQPLADDGCVFTLLDISSESRAEKEIEDFLFIASHDLQEPLRKIISFGERIERNKEQLGEENNLYLSRMMNATGRMQNMLTGLLSFSHIRRNGEAFTDCDLSDVADEAFRNASRIVSRPNARFSLEKLPVLEADRSQMLQLFQEVLVNALKFQAPDSVPDIRVSSEVDLLTRKAKIFIADNGIGFDGEHAERVFQLFYRLNGRAAFDGAGIGLAICRKIADAHGGEIKAYSGTGRGTTIEIALPLSRQATRF